MKELTVQRVNFLHKRYAPFTYRSMVKILTLLGGALFFIYFIVFANSVYIKKKVVTSQAELKAFNEQKDQQLKVIEGMSQRTESERAEKNLADILNEGPRWSKVLKGLAKVLPQQVRLTEVKTVRNPDKRYVMSLKGRASSRTELADFVSKLGSSGEFARTELSVSTHSAGLKGGLDFEVHTQPNMKMFE